MPTELKNYSMNQDATMIFFDMVKDSETFEMYLSDLFDEGQYIYQSGQSMGGQELFHFLSRKLSEGDLMPVPSGRILCCFHMMLQDLTDEWVDRFFEKAYELRRFAPLTNLFDQHYMILLRNSAGYIQDSTEKERINRLLIRLGTESPDISHQVYLMRTAGFGADFMSQEKAVAYMLHLLTRQGYSSVVPMKYGMPLRMLDSGDYYAARAENCHKHIEDINNWQNRENDPGLAELIDCIRVPIQGAAAKMEDELKTFRRRTARCPVSVNNYEGGFFKGYHRVLSPNHPILQQIQAEFVGETRGRLVESTGFGEIRDLIKREYHYPDLRMLAERLENGSLKAACVSDEGQQRNDEGKAALFDMLYEKAEAEIRKAVPDVDTMLKKRLAEKRKYTRELILAGKYRDIEDCFQRIDQEVEPEQIAGHFALNVNTTALVSGEPASNWLIRNYSINGVMTAYRYPAIRPCEIVMIKESDIVDLSSAGAATELNIIY